MLDLDQATLEEGRIFASNLLASPDKVAMLMRKAKDHSRNANQTPIKDTAADVASIIQRYPGLTTEEVRDKLEQEFDKTLSGHRVRRIINFVMEKRGISWPTGIKNTRWSFEN